MSNQYNTYEIDVEYEDEDHAEKEDEKRITKLMEENNLEYDQYGDIVQKTNTVVKSLICSCGYFTCPSIRKFGHPQNVFKESIEPLSPQGKRDKRALQLKNDN